MTRRGWHCRCDLTVQDRLVFIEDTEPHYMEKVNDTDVYVCYTVNHQARTVTVERIRTLEGDDAPVGGQVFG